MDLGLVRRRGLLADDGGVGFGIGESLGLALGEALKRDGVVDCKMLHSFLFLVVVVDAGGGVPCFMAYNVSQQWSANASGAKRLIFLRRQKEKMGFPFLF